MSNQNAEEVDGVFQAIANWIQRYREAIGLRAELAICEPQHVAEIAKDIGLSSDQLRFAVEKGSRAADELPKLLRAIGVDPQRLSSTNPALMRSLESICITCDHKKQCQHNLSADTAAGHYQYYCPNAVSLKALFQGK